MADWKTEEFKAAIEAMPLVCKAEVGGSGGDFDTNNITVSVEGAYHRLFIRGFGSTEKSIEELGATHDFVPSCEFVELNCGLDSRGGLRSDQLNVGLVYARINSYLRKRGFNVIGHYKQVF